MADRLRRGIIRRERSGMMSLSGWSTVLTNIVAPVGILVAYLYWFAYVRASAYYGFFGVSGAIGLQFQNQENAADSILALFSPIAIFALLAMAAAAMHRSITRALDWRLMPRMAIPGIFVLSALSFLAFLVEWLPATFLTSWSGGPGWLEYLQGAVGVLLLNYALYLKNSFARPKQRPNRLRLWVSAVLILALALAATSSYASGLGFERALRVVETGGLSSVTLYSREDQSLTGPGITATKISATDGYKYRYTGLRLLTVRGTHFILVPEGTKKEPPAAILITEGDGVRIEIGTPD